MTGFVFSSDEMQCLLLGKKLNTCGTKSIHTAGTGYGFKENIKGLIFNVACIHLPDKEITSGGFWKKPMATKGW